MNRTENRVFFFLLALSLSSCGMFRIQNIRVDAPSNSEVLLDNVSVGIVGDQPTRMNTMNGLNQDIQIKKEGCKTMYDVLLIAPYMASGKRKRLDWKYELVELPRYSSFSKEIKLTEIVIDSSVQVTVNRYSSPRQHSLENEQSSEDLVRPQFDDLLQRSGDISIRIHEKFDSYGTFDTSKLSFNRHGDLFLRISVNRIIWKNYEVKGSQEILARTCVVDASYHVKDHTGKTIFNDTILATSGNFWISVLDHYVITDALEYGIIELLAKEEILSEMRSETPHDFNAQLQEIGVSVTDGKTKPLELLSQAYFLTTEDEKILGLPVGKDGVLVFPKSSLTFIDDYKITGQDGKEFEGKPVLDMALSELTFIQIDQKFDKTFSLRTSELDLIEDIYLIGADIYYKSAILSEGIVGGKRNTEDHLTYQTDAESGHMIWPFAIDKNGNICGVITRDVHASSMAFFPSIKLVE